jgi:hypothetical protein
VFNNISNSGLSWLNVLTHSLCSLLNELPSLTHHRSCPYLHTSHMGPDLLDMAGSALRKPVSGFEPLHGLPHAALQKRLHEAISSALRSAARSSSIAARLMASRRPAAMLMIHPSTGKVYANVSGVPFSWKWSQSGGRLASSARPLPAST